MGVALAAKNFGFRASRHGLAPSSTARRAHAAAAAAAATAAITALQQLCNARTPHLLNPPRTYALATHAPEESPWTRAAARRAASRPSPRPPRARGGRPRRGPGAPPASLGGRQRSFVGSRLRVHRDGASWEILFVAQQLKISCKISVRDSPTTKGVGEVCYLRALLDLQVTDVRPQAVGGCEWGVRKCIGPPPPPHVGRWSVPVQA